MTARGRDRVCARSARAAHASAAVALVACAAALSGAGCGGGEFDPSPDGGQGDAPPQGCQMTATFTPERPAAGTTVVVNGSITGVAPGVETYEWTVTRGGSAVETSAADPDSREVRFLADVPGTYDVVLQGSSGGERCTDFAVAIGVIDPGGLTTDYRVRAAPTPGQGAPVQDELVTVRGGANAIRDLNLDDGAAIAGAVTDGANPLAAYIRITPANDPAPAPIEAFSGANGAFSATLALGTYDVLVVPELSPPAPIRLLSVPRGSLSSLVVTPGATLAGTVRDAAGAPVAGARVTVRAGGAPSTLGVTDASGAFSLSARTGGAVAIAVAPPDGSGLPALTLEPGVVATASLDIQYQAAAAPRAVSATVRLSDGATPAPGARVSWLGRPAANAATVRADGGAPVAMAGHVQVAVIAGAGGALPPLSLPQMVYDVIVEPPPGADPAEAARLAVIDLAAGSPAALSLAASARVDGVALAPGGVPAAGVRVTAIPDAPLAAATTGAAQVTTNAAGEFSLPVVGDGGYTLVFEGAGPNAIGAPHARTFRTVQAAPPGQTTALGQVALTPAVTLTGKVTIPGVAGGAAGVHLLVLCYDCAGPDAARAVAEAVSGAGGSYTLRIPDPGVVESGRVSVPRRAGR